MSECANWLYGFLKSGAKTQEAVYEIAEMMGYSKGQVENAKRECRVKSVHADVGKWLWSLPEDSDA